MSETLRVVRVSVCGLRFSPLAISLAALPNSPARTMLVEHTAEAIAVLELLKASEEQKGPDDFIVPLSFDSEIAALREGLEALGASVETELKLARHRLGMRYHADLVRSAVQAAL